MNTNFNDLLKIIDEYKFAIKGYEKLTDDLRIALKDSYDKYWKLRESIPTPLSTNSPSLVEEK
jgi:hypothetical protein